MKIFKRILIGVLILILIVLIGGCFYIRYISHKGIADYNGEIKLNGISEKVTVYRDSLGIPHVFAANETDLYRSVGFIMAQDRLWQMDLLRRATTGRLAEIFGEDMVETDFLMRAIRIPEKSKQMIDSLSPIQKEYINSFCDGVNQYIDTNIDNLPLEFTLLGYKPEKWTPEHSANLVGFMAWDLASGWSEEITLFTLRSKFDEKRLQELYPDFKLMKGIVYPTSTIDSLMKKTSIKFQNISKIEKLGIAGIMNASNNWAVSGKKTTTGKPILANDMHLAFSAPGIWYQVHQYVEGKLNVTGVALPGQPFIVCGHNQNIAWGMTNVYVDDIDFYLETINPENPNQYKFNGKWCDLIVKKEIIKIKGGKQVEKTLKFTHRGPIISEIKKIKDEAISMRWLGNENSNEFRSIFLLNRAKNWSEFKNALKTFISVSQNVNYVDTEGNIGIYCAAGIPKRKGNGYVIKSGETDEFDWKGFVPFDSLPHEFNPEKGYVSSANNRTTDSIYPYYIGKWYGMSYRFDRINQMINENEKISIETIKNMQTDDLSLFAKQFIPEILKANAEKRDYSEIEKECFNLLRSWDFRMTKESSQAAIFEKFYVLLYKNIFGDELTGDSFYKASGFYRFVIDKIMNGQDVSWCDNEQTKDKKETFKDIAIATFKETVKELSAELGNEPSKWHWGDIHKITLAHPIGRVKILNFIFKLNKGPYQIGGASHTVAPYSYSIANPFDVRHGASHRHIYSTSNWDESETVVPTGVSGIPASDFYCNQTQMFLNGIYNHDYFSKSKIEKSYKYKMEIK